MTTEDLVLEANKVFFEEHYSPYSTGTAIEIDDVKDLMITFAKHHVQEALKAALEDIPYGGHDNIHYEDVKHILTESYPLTNIK